MQEVSGQPAHYKGGNHAYDRSEIWDHIAYTGENTDEYSKFDMQYGKPYG